jgi:hypothetical protein
MLLQEFSERAAECVHLAERAGSEHDRALFIELARAWCGLDEAESVEEESSDETPPPH